VVLSIFELIVSTPWIEHQFHPSIEVKRLPVLPGNMFKVFKTFLILGMIDPSLKLFLSLSSDLFTTKKIKVSIDLFLITISFL